MQQGQWAGVGSCKGALTLFLNAAVATFCQCCVAFLCRICYSFRPPERGFVLSNPLGRPGCVSCGALQFYDYNKVQQLTAIDLSSGMLDQVRGYACFSSSSVLQAASIAWHKVQGQSLHWTLGQEGKWTIGAQVSHLNCGRVQGLLLRLLTFRATRARPGVHIRPHSPNVVLACASHPTGACTGVAPITRQAHQFCAGRCHAASS